MGCEVRASHLAGGLRCVGERGSSRPLRAHDAIGDENG